MGFKSKVRSNVRPLSGLIRRVKGFGTPSVESGYYEEQMHPTWNIPLSTIAAINEFGYFGIPIRNFMWQSFWNWERESNTATTKYAMGKYIYHNVPINSLLKEVGDDLNNKIKWTIQWEGDFVSNSPTTISYKGFDYPLVNTGYLRDNAIAKVKK